MRLDDFEKFDITARDESGRCIDTDEVKAFAELVKSQGNLLDVSPEVRAQLKKLKLQLADEHMPDGFFIDFSLNILSNEGTWNFHNRRMGEDVITPFPGNLPSVSGLSLKDILSEASRHEQT